MNQTDAKRGQRRAAQRVRVGMGVCRIVLDRMPVLVGVSVSVSVAQRSMAVRVKMEVTLNPSEEEPCRENDDEKPNSGLGDPMHLRRKPAAKKDNRKTESKERRGVPEAPGQAQTPRFFRPIPLLVQQESRYGREMIRVGRVAQSEEQRHNDCRQHPESILRTRSEITDPAFPQPINSGHDSQPTR